MLQNNAKFSKMLNWHMPKILAISNYWSFCKGVKNNVPKLLQFWSLEFWVGVVTSMHSHSHSLGTKSFQLLISFSFSYCYYKAKEQLLWQLVQQPPKLMVVDNKALQWRGWWSATRTPKLHYDKKKTQVKVDQLFMRI
jgi:hypothetical protein